MADNNPLQGYEGKNILVADQLPVSQAGSFFFRGVFNQVY